MIYYYFCSMTIKANCKINIGLDVLQRRQDGFHDLSTVMYPIKGLYDILDIEPLEGSQTQFISKGFAIDCPPEQNLCIKAYELIKHSFPQIGALRITLDKRIPFGAGLGGGSADATSVLLAINTIFDLALSESQLIALAAQLGSDTAYFVRNSAQLCSGRGDIMKPVELDLSGKYIALVKPDIAVSTRQAYAGVKPAYPTTPLEELIEQPIEQWQASIKNDFEPHIFQEYPLLAQIKAEMIEAGALYAAMSGSGSTIYGIFDEVTKAKSERLESHSPYYFEL